MGIQRYEIQDRTAGQQLLGQTKEALKASGLASGSAEGADAEAHGILKAWCLEEQGMLSELRGLGASRRIRNQQTLWSGKEPTVFDSYLTAGSFRSPL